MRISRLLMPAVTLAGALALAGCGGGSGTTAEEEDDTDMKPPVPVNCGGGVTAPTSAGCKDALDAANATEEAAKKATATGKALYAALVGPDATAGNPLANITNPRLSSAGLVLNVAAGAGTLASTVTAADVTLKAGQSAGSLGGWSGTDYAESSGTGDNKVTDEARVYANRAAPTPKPFTEVYGDDNDYVAATRILSGVESDAVSLIKIPSITGTAGTRALTGAQDLEGTYDGASGRYKCASTCGVVLGGTGIASLTGSWTFTHVSGATVSQTETEYLYYGWWVHKGSDGDPDAVSAFTGSNLPGAQNGWTGPLPTGLRGSATYNGKAAGKYAWRNLEADSAHGGHFTADAALTAKFGAPTATNDLGLTGTVSNFRLNDGTTDPGWSVALNRTGFGNDGATNDTDTSVTANTVWSVNGNKSPASGRWEATMYDEKPGGAAPAGDGSNVPTTATGTFHSEFGGSGRMVGAFGVEHKE